MIELDTTSTQPITHTRETPREWLRHRRNRLWVAPVLILATIFTTLFTVNPSPAQALATPSLSGWLNSGYSGTKVLNFGGTTSCWSLSGTSAMNDISSVIGYNLKQYDQVTTQWHVWEVTGYNHGDCTDYLFHLGNGSTTQLSNLGTAPCYCNDELSGFSIRRIS